jgi:hypothetical protein
MIICSKQEANGATREFLIDQDMGPEVHVRTHTVNRDDWSEAGIITRGGQGLEVAISSPNTSGRFVKLNKTFPNEIAALQAIAVSYRPN